jgi:hypothetical protein
MISTPFAAAPRLEKAPSDRPARPPFFARLFALLIK